MKIGFDLDDVVFDSISGFVDEGISLGLIPSGTTPNDLEGKLEDQFCICDDDMKNLLNVEMYDKIEAFDEIVTDILRWMKQGEEVFFVTARTDKYTPGIEGVTANCLDRIGLLEGASGVHHIRSSKKHELCKDLGIDVFVDDMPHIIRLMEGCVPHLYLKESPQNTRVSDLKRWSWKEIREEIDALRARA